jgi:hypothetical protein
MSEDPKPFRSFTCSECGGTVELRGGPGRTMGLYSTVGAPDLPIPNYLSLPQCTKCGEIFLPCDASDELWTRLKERFDMLVWQRLDALQRLVCSGLARCECGRLATQVVTRVVRGLPIQLDRCDRCWKGAPGRELPQAEAVRALEKLEEGPCFND